MSTLPFKVKAIHDYTSPHDDDLTFPSGQIITVTEEEDAEWYIGEYTGEDGAKRDGLFPRNFVEKYEPQAPPRPVRSRPKQEPHDTQETIQNISKHEEQEPTTTVSEGVEPEAPSQPVVKEQLPSAPKPKAAKPAPPVGNKPPPPDTAAKPSSNSFKDRIAAFNKPAAPPIAPKPSGAPAGQGFIKKPFVAPPPARNAYVPPPRVEASHKTYRREEDPEIAERKLQDQKEAEEAGLAGVNVQNEDDAPKATSLKDRIALLQKQQQEAAARRAEVGSKEKSKKPPQPEKELTGAPIVDDDDDDDDYRNDQALSHSVSNHSTDATRPTPGRLASHDSDTFDLQRDVLSDGNEADQSGAGETTEDAGGDSTEVEEAADANKPMAPRTSTGGSERHVEKTEEQPARGDQDSPSEDEEDMDPETKRREELRARMAKMSGGMGMPGMFGIPTKAPPPTKKQSGSSDQRSPSQEARSPPPRQRVPIMPVPGVPSSVESPKTVEDETPVVGREPEQGLPLSERSPGETVPDMEDLKAEPHEGTTSLDSSNARKLSKDRPLPPTPPIAQASAPPPIPGDRPVPKTENRPVPPPPPGTLRATDKDSQDSADEVVEQRPFKPTSPHQSPAAPQAPPRVPGLAMNMPSVDSPAQATSRDNRASQMASSPPIDPAPSSPPTGKGERPVPPIPVGSPQMPPASALARPPPPPPPSAVPPSRQSTGRESLVPPSGPGDDHESEYEGDYDTDIAPTAPHKDALKARVGRESSFDDESTLSEDGSSRPPLSAHPPAAPFTARAPPPPPPPHQAPPSRKSTDAPRAPPPVPPPHYDDDDYDPYRYDAPAQLSAGSRKAKAPLQTPPIRESDPSLYATSSHESHDRVPPPLPPNVPPPPQRHNVPPPLPPEHRDVPLAPVQDSGEAVEMPRRSLDPPRQVPAGRRSMDPGTRAHIEDSGHIAKDIDLAEASVWWSQPNNPPSSLQNRNDVLYEMDDSNTSKRDGRSMRSRNVYVLFHDYSQTVITATFDPKDPSHDVQLEQKHEAPPSKMRQDQLEEAHTKFGERVAAAAMSKQNQTIGDGSPQALVVDLMQSSAPGALRPVGTRAYGALIYSNMANASVSQHDEIRPGDIVSFRNARFKGKHGAMHAKYSMDVGKPEHVAIVMEWDGTKKKIRAWEQGREKEGKKLKVESFRVGDLGAGEVKVWRIVGRQWVGWDANV